VPNAVLPAFCLGDGSFVSVLLEPVVDVAENHGVTICMKECLVYELGVWLLLIYCDLAPGVATGRIRRHTVVRRGSSGHGRVGASIACVILHFDEWVVWIVIVIAHLHEVSVALLV